MGAAAARVIKANASEVGGGAAKAQGAEIADSAIKSSFRLAIREMNVRIRLLTIQTNPTVSTVSAKTGRNGSPKKCLLLAAARLRA